jgi:hypothetical protein
MENVVDENGWICGPPLPSFDGFGHHQRKRMTVL